MTARIRVAVLGCAGIARRRMLPAFAASPDVEVAVVASRDPAKAEQVAQQYGCRAARSYTDAVEDSTVDAVYVPLPAALHARWVEAALEAGKHVLAEKPLTLDGWHTARLFESAGRRGLALMENVMFVHHSQHAAVARMVAEGAIGQVRSMRAVFAVPRLADDDIRHRPELGGGALWDTGVYPIRAALHFLGPELRVVGATSARTSPHAVDTAGAILLDTPDGVSAQLAYGLDHGYQSGYELLGSKGRISLDRAFTPPADHRPTVCLEDGSGPRRISLPAEDQVAATVTAFAAAVRLGAAPAEVTEGSLRQAALLDEVRALGTLVGVA
ncbi:Gfo/Idh/MocA family oxidoreductase [Streptomyces sp. NPDC006645]|uniref:Gfo/Idh/MocA family protein n=1 Tax=unclassified Streptomyces TaxID=2593676 RepID=UPI0033BEA4DC